MRPLHSCHQQTGAGLSAQRAGHLAPEESSSWMCLGPDRRSRLRGGMPFPTVSSAGRRKVFLIVWFPL